METLWLIVVVGGPIVLAIGLLWAMSHNRLSRRDKAASDAAARRMRTEQSADDRARDA